MKKINCYTTLSIMNIILFGATAYTALQEGSGISILPTLEEAVSNGNQAAVALLIKARANVHTKVGEDREPLINTTESLDVIKLLLKARASVQDKSSTLETPLHKAVRCSNLEIIRFLIQRAANIYAKNMVGETPLTLAQEGGVEQVTLLLEKEDDKIKKAREQLEKGKAELAQTQIGTKKTYAEIDKMKQEIEQIKRQTKQIPLTYRKTIEEQDEAHRLTMAKFNDAYKELENNERQRNMQFEKDNEDLSNKKTQTLMAKEQLKKAVISTEKAQRDQQIALVQGVVQTFRMAGEAISSLKDRPRANSEAITYGAMSTPQEFGGAVTYRPISTPSAYRPTPQIEMIDDESA